MAGNKSLSVTVHFTRWRSKSRHSMSGRPPLLRKIVERISLLSAFKSFLAASRASSPHSFLKELVKTGRKNLSSSSNRIINATKSASCSRLEAWKTVVSPLNCVVSLPPTPQPVCSSRTKPPHLLIAAPPAYFLLHSYTPQPIFSCTKLSPPFLLRPISPSAQ